MKLPITALDAIRPDCTDAAGRMWHLDRSSPDGSFSWSSPDAATIVWATPFYEDRNGIAVQADLEEGDPVAFTVSLSLPLGRWTDDEAYLARLSDILALFR